MGEPPTAVLIEFRSIRLTHGTIFKESEHEQPFIFLLVDRKILGAIDCAFIEHIETLKLNSPLILVRKLLYSPSNGTITLWINNISHLDLFFISNQCGEEE